MKRFAALVFVLPITACVDVPVVSGGSGKAGGDTVLVCHKGKKTMELPREAAKAHLNHGDKSGPC